MRNPERAHDPTSRARHAHEHPSAQSRGERRSHARDTAHKPRTALVPAWPRPCKGRPGRRRRSTQVCARDWRRPAGGGGSGSILRTRDWIRGRGRGWGARRGSRRHHGRQFRLPHRPARVGRTSLPERPHRAVVGRQGCAFGAHHRPRLRARDGESERFRQRSTWRSGRVSEGRSPANNGHATR